jgi:hypothetical protein
MLEKIPKERDQFGFPEAVLNSFRFLVEDFGFLVVRQEATYLRFESDAVFVNVYHGRASYEVGVEIGELQKANKLSERSFTLGEIIAMTNFEMGSNFRFYQATRPELIQNCVAETAGLVKGYSRAALIGDRNFFEGLSNIRSRISREYLKGMEMGRVRQDAEAAWREKNYEELVELYESVKGDLTPAEVKKLEYAKRKLADIVR